VRYLPFPRNTKNSLLSITYAQPLLDFTGKTKYNNFNKLEEKSTAGCANNQRCLFNHSVIAHDVAEEKN
jgi:hypothetical protein